MGPYTSQDTSPDLIPGLGLDEVAGPDTGPILVLRAQGLSTRQIGRRLHMSQSTVQRRLTEMRHLLEPGEAAEPGPARSTDTWRLVMGISLMVLLAVIAASLATLAWGG